MILISSTTCDSEALVWAANARAVVVVVEPPDEAQTQAGAGAAWARVSARASLCALLPGAPPASLGRLWLANVAPPARLLRSFGVNYRPPFGAASVIALHPTDL